MKEIYKIIIFTIIIVNLVAFIVFFTGNNQQTSNNNQNTTITTSNKSTINSTTAKQISIEELSNHNNKTDCWVEYKNKAYDLTSWLTKHPGGVNAIVQYCGTDKFEEAFIQKHGTTKASLFLQVAKLMGDFEIKGNMQ